MNFDNNITLIFIIAVFFFCSCQKNTNEVSEQSDEDFEMYEMSEMSLLMEQMYADNEQLKNKIINGELPDDFPEHFLNIHTYKTTKEDQRDDFFEEQSALFLEAYKNIYEDKSSPKEAFNHAVDMCIQCHEVKCQGPIARIEKLYIK